MNISFANLNFIAALFGMLVSGCMTMPSYNVRVDSISNESVSDWKTFTIISGMQDTPSSDLYFQEYAKIISNALVFKGYVVAEKNQRPDAVVLLAYGISKPNASTKTTYMPIYNSGTTTTVSGSSGQHLGTLETRNSNPYSPSGYLPMQSTSISYRRAISLAAYRSKSVPTDETVQLWQTLITSEGESGDLRKVFPVMIFAARKHLASNGGRSDLSVSVDDDDPRIEVLKSGKRRPADFNEDDQ